ncbi:hypothetical protein [Microbulbifer mangrovi]|uniref:hypothetical protein n=1 Tax=Microbulbifer mangrovi TaxID=927787 RepID=UPI00099093DC|nr:hypothetical protein [Microbulbifer mangrovi]
MSAPTYSVIFRGDLEPGYTVADVKANFARLFKAGPDTVEKLFSGRPLAIKKGMAQVQAEQLQATLSKLGAQSTVRAEGGEQPVPQPSAPSPEPVSAPVADAGETTPVQSAVSDSSLSLAPMEGNLVKAHEKKSVEAVQVEVNHLSLKPAEGNLLEAGERKPEAAPAVSVPDWKLDNHISGKASFEVPD